MAPKKNLVSRKKVYRKKGKRTMKKRNMKGGGNGIKLKKYMDIVSCKRTENYIKSSLEY